MKKILSFILIILFTGCSNLPKPVTPTTQSQAQAIVVTATPELVPIKAPELPTDTSLPEQITSEKKAFDSEAFIAYLKENGFPIGNVVVYTEETDPNKFLGRPNQYISKLNFSDTTLSPDADNLNGGSIEVFLNPEDAEARKTYIDTIGKQMPVLSEYSFIRGNTLLRLSRDLTPTKAREYEKYFNSFYEN